MPLFNITFNDRHGQLNVAWTATGAASIRPFPSCGIQLGSRMRLDTVETGWILYKQYMAPNFVKYSPTENDLYLPGSHGPSDTHPVTPNGVRQTFVLLESLAILADQITRAKLPE